jgi:hypothetical protein
MNVIEKNAGPKIEYKQESESIISFRDELFLNLEKYERDYPVQIDICENEDGILTTGISKKYIAQIEIPARKYSEIPIQETGTEIEGESIKLEPVPFSMDNIILTLWAIK